MVSPDYNIKYKYEYPVLTFVLYSLLTLMACFVLDYFSLIQLNILFIIVIVIFLFEAIIRFNVSLKLGIPKLFVLLEQGLYILILSVFTEGFNDIGLYLVWLFSFLSWLSIHEMTNYFNLFRLDCVKVYETINRDKIESSEEPGFKLRKSKKGKLDEFRKLLEYSSIWKKIAGKILLSNIFLVLIWMVINKLDLWLIIGSTIFLFIEIFLLVLLFLDKKSLDWFIEGIEIPATLKEKWSNFFLLIFLVVIVFTLLLPYNYSPLPLDKIANWIKSVPLKPHIIPIQENLGPGSPPPGISQRPPAGNSGISPGIFVFLQILLGLTFGFFILTLILFFLKEEYRKIKGLPDLLREYYKYIRNLIKGLFIRTNKLKKRISSIRIKARSRRKGKKDFKKEVFQLKNIRLTGELAPMIITIYKTMLKLFALRGTEKNKGQTPYEFSQLIGEKYTDIKEEFRKITELYVEVSYSNHKLKDRVKGLVKSLWKKLSARL